MTNMRDRARLAGEQSETASLRAALARADADRDKIVSERLDAIRRAAAAEARCGQIPVLEESRDHWRARANAAESALSASEARATAAEEHSRGLASALQIMGEENARLERERDEARADLAAWGPTKNALRRENANLAARAERAEEALREAEKKTRDVALMSSAYLGAVMSDRDVVTVTAGGLREARLVRVENRPGGGVRLVLTDDRLGEELARLSAARPAEKEEGR